MSDPVTTPLPTRLHEATAGLLWPSETDSPIEVVTWPEGHDEPTDAALRHASHAAADAPVTETTVTALLAPLTVGTPGDDEIGKKNTERFRALADLLGTLPGARAWRVGGPKIHLWILAPHEKGWIGLRTNLVET